MYSDSSSDDDSHAPNSHKSTCVNCGSTHFYRDDQTDNLICLECHTQSQTQSQREVCDEEDFTLAATQGGRVIGRSRKRGGGGGGGNDEDLDKSVPLPNVVDCCDVFQYLLKAAVERVVLLSGIGASMQHNRADGGDDVSIQMGRQEENGEEIATLAMMSLVKEIWFKYLESWQESADYYATTFPEVRFSFRDLFLDRTSRNMLLRFMSAQATEQLNIKEQLGENQFWWKEDTDKALQNRKRSQEAEDATPFGSHQRKKRVKWENDRDGEFSDGTPLLSAKEEDDKANLNGSKKYEQAVYQSPNGKYYRFYRKPYNTFNELTAPIKSSKRREHYSKEQPILDKHLATLRLKPSLTLLTSIVYLALLKLRTGVSSFHFTTWASNGSFPFLINVLNLLPPEKKKLLMRISNTMFVNRAVPQPAELDHQVDLLIIACGYANNNKDGIDDGGDFRCGKMAMERPEREFAKLQSVNFLPLSKQELREFLQSGQSSIKVFRQIRKKRMKEAKEAERVASSRKMRKKDGNLGSNENETNGNLVSQVAEEEEAIQNEYTRAEEKGGANMYQDNIPMMTCRFVTDLGMNQRVLDVALALMDLYIKPTLDSTDEEWLPGSLEGAKVQRLVSPLHVMAVIVVACKMCDGWENWKLSLNPKTMFSNKGGKPSATIISNHSEEFRDPSVKLEYNDYDNMSLSSTWQKGDSTKNYNDPTQQRFIPWDEDQLNTIGNGKMLKDYLDYIEETHGTQFQIIPEFRDIIPSLQKVISNATRVSGDESSPTSNATVKPNTVLAGDTNPTKPRFVKKKGPHLYEFIRMGHKGAIWADANGYGEYVIYKDLKSHAVAKATAEATNNLTSEPFHPHYGLLIEYVSDKMCAEPGELHYLVACLDEEISVHSRPLLDWNRDYYSGNRNKRKSMR